MTTQVLDNKNCTFNFVFLWWHFPGIFFKQRFGRFSSLPPMPPPPQNREFYFYCCLSVFDYNLGPAKTYILRGAPRTYAVKTRA